MQDRPTAHVHLGRVVLRGLLVPLASLAVFVTPTAASAHHIVPRDDCRPSSKVVRFFGWSGVHPRVCHRHDDGDDGIAGGVTGRKVG